MLLLCPWTHHHSQPVAVSTSFSFYGEESIRRGMGYAEKHFHSNGTVPI